MNSEEEVLRGRWAKATVDDPHFKQMEDELHGQAFSVMLNAPLGEEGDSVRRNAALMANAITDVRNWLENWAAFAD